MHPKPGHPRALPSLGCLGCSVLSKAGLKLGELPSSSLHIWKTRKTTKLDTTMPQSANNDPRLFQTFQAASLQLWASLDVLERVCDACSFLPLGQKYTIITPK